ncbi:MAG: hypothetical protein AABZ39_05545 [Spirochaetota bacterium]
MEPLMLSMTVVGPVVVYFVFRQFDRTGKTLDKINKWFQQRVSEFDRIFDQKSEQFQDNSIELDIAVKKAGHLSKVLEGELSRLSDRLESYKDFEASIEKYTGQISDIERAYLSVLDKIDVVLEEKNKIDKTYRRTNDIKRSMLDLEKSIDSLQKHLVGSYNSKFADFEKELYRRFEMLAENLTKKDERYNSVVAEQESKMQEAVAAFTNAIEEREIAFNKHLGELNERVAAENFERIRSIFDRAKSELNGAYEELTSGIQQKTAGMEERYVALDVTRVRMEEDLELLKNDLNRQLADITAETAARFNEDIVRTKDRIMATIDDTVREAATRKEDLLAAFESRADSLIANLDDKVGRMADDLAAEQNRTVSAIQDTYHEFEDQLKLVLEDQTARSDSARREMEDERASVLNSMRDVLHQAEERIGGVMTHFAESERVLDERANACNAQIQEKGDSLLALVTSTADERLSRIAESERAMGERADACERQILEKRDSLLAMVSSAIDMRLDAFDGTVDRKVIDIEGRFTEKHEGYKREYDEKVRTIVELSRTIGEEERSLAAMVSENYRSHTDGLAAVSEELSTDISDVRAMIVDKMRDMEKAAGHEGSTIAEYIRKAKDRTVDYLASVYKTLEQKVARRMNAADEERRNAVAGVASMFADMRTVLGENLRIIDGMKAEYRERLESAITDGESAVREKVSVLEGTISAVKNGLEDAYEGVSAKRHELEETMRSFKAMVDEHRVTFESGHFKDIEQKVVGLEAQVLAAQENYAAAFSEKERAVQARIGELTSELSSVSETTREKFTSAFAEKEHDVEVRIGELDRTLHTIRETAEGKFTAAFAEKERDMEERIDMLDRDLRTVSDVARAAGDAAEKVVTDRLNSISVDIGSRIDAEMTTLTPKVEKAIDDVIRKRHDYKGKLDNTAKSIEKIEAAIEGRITTVLDNAERAVADNLSTIEKTVGEREKAILDEMRETVSRVYEAEKADLAGEKKRYTAEIESLTRRTQAKHAGELARIDKEIVAVKKRIAVMADDAKEKLSDALAVRDGFLIAVKDNEKHLAELSGGIRRLKEELEPAVIRLHQSFDERIAQLNERIGETAERLLARESEFARRFEETLASAAAAHEAKKTELAASVEDMEAHNDRAVNGYLERIITQSADIERKNAQMLTAIEHRIQGIVSEKESQYESLSRGYRDLSESIGTMRSHMKDTLDAEVTHGREELADKFDEMTRELAARDASFSEQFSERLNAAVARLVDEAEHEVLEAKAKIASEFDTHETHTRGSIDRLTGMIGDLELSMADMRERAEAQGEKHLAAFDGKVKDRMGLFAEDLEMHSRKTLLEFDARAERFQKELSRLDRAMTEFKDGKESELSGQYAALKDRLAGMETQVAEFMEQAKLLDRAEDLRGHLRKDLDQFTKVLRTTAKEKDELMQTMSEFNELKRMHTEVKGYSVQLQKEKTSLIDTEQKVKLLVTMTNDIEGKLAGIQGGEKDVKRIGESVEKILALAGDLSEKYDAMREKKTAIDAALTSVYETEERTKSIASHVESLTLTLNDVSDKKERLLSKIKEIEKDTAILTRNDEKVKLLIERFEQVDQMLEFMNEQNDRLSRQKDFYQKQGENVEENLKKAEKMADTLKALLDEAQTILIDAYADDAKSARGNEEADPVPAARERRIDAKKEKLIIDLYRMGWEYPDIVKNTNRSIEEIDMIIKQWKMQGKQS